MFGRHKNTTHQHRWDVETLEDDFVPGIPSYVTRCACGAVRPYQRVPQHVDAPAA